MTTQRTIIVVGGTGRVGRSVAFSLQGNPDFHVKVTTRDPNSAKAQRISQAGIEAIKADSWDGHELNTAFTGAWGVFLNTDSESEDFSKHGRLECDMGRNVIDAAIKQGVSTFVYAGLPNATELSNGKVRITSFDHKNAISAYGRAVGFQAFVNVNVGWQMENFWNPLYEIPFGGFCRVRDAEGFFTIKIFAMTNEPESTPFTSIRDDYGDIAHGVFLDPTNWDGKVVWAVSDPISFQEVADLYNRVSGTNDARYVVQKELAPAATPEKSQEVNGVRYYSEFVKGDYCGGKPTDLTDARTLKRAGAVARGVAAADAKLQTFEGFIRAYGLNNESM